MTGSTTPSDRNGLDGRIQVRLERAGTRLRAAETERRAALAELHSAIIEADGALTARAAAELTGLPGDLLKTIQPQLGDER